MCSVDYYPKVGSYLEERKKDKKNFVIRQIDEWGAGPAASAPFIYLRSGRVVEGAGKHVQLLLAGELHEVHCVARNANG